MNCLGPDRSKKMVDAIVRMEKAAVLAPALVEQMGKLLKEAHRQHVQCAEWTECQMPICVQTKGMLEIAEEVLRED